MVCFLPRDALLALLQQSSAAVCLWVQIRWLTWPLKNTNKFLALRNSCVAFAECFGVIICLHCKCCPVSFAASGLAWAECNWYDFWFFPVTSFSRHIISKALVTWFCWQSCIPMPWLCLHHVWKTMWYALDNKLFLFLLHNFLFPSFRCVLFWTKKRENSVMI